MMLPGRDTTETLAHQLEVGKVAVCIVLDRAGPRVGRQPAADAGENLVSYLTPPGDMDADDRAVALNLQLVLVCAEQSNAEEWNERAHGQPVPHVHLWSQTMRDNMAPYLDYDAEMTTLPGFDSVFGRVMIWHADDLISVSAAMADAGGAEAAAEGGDDAGAAVDDE